jgi:phosphopantothenate synthetase
VHWNLIRRRVRIHRAECGACNDGKGMHKGKIAAGRGKTYDWIPGDTYSQAKAEAKASPPARRGAAVIDCRLCDPGRMR